MDLLVLYLFGMVINEPSNINLSMIYLFNFAKI